MNDHLFTHRLHPVPGFCYLGAAVIFSVTCRHPAAVLFLLGWGLILLLLTEGPGAALGSLGFSALSALLMGALNPFFAARGETVWFFISGVPYTAEAFFCGAVTGAMLGSAAVWCRCFSGALTGEKLAYLTGRRLPRTALVFSLSLGAVPRLSRQIPEIDAAQAPLGLYRSDRLSDRIRGRAATLSVLITRALEGSAETADAMVSRGWGLKGHTCAARYPFGPADAVFTAAAVLCAAVLSVCAALGALDFDYYPALSACGEPWARTAGVVAAALFGALPVLGEAAERILWHVRRPAA